jgi:hypothetical protein
MLGSGKGTVCGECHGGVGDKGAALADSMHKQFVGLKDGIGRSQLLMSRLGNAGIEVSSEQLALHDANQRLTLARTEMHAADHAAIDPIVGEGLKIVSAVDKKGEEGLAELRYRRTGLAVSLGLILIVVALLAVKVRQLDRQRP